MKIKNLIEKINEKVVDDVRIEEISDDEVDQAMSDLSMEGFEIYEVVREINGAITEAYQTRINIILRSGKRLDKLYAKFSAGKMDKNEQAEFLTSCKILKKYAEKGLVLSDAVARALTNFTSMIEMHESELGKLISNLEDTLGQR